MEKVRKYPIALFIIVFFVAGFFIETALSAEYKTAEDFVKAARAEIKEISVAEARNMMESEPLIILDVREEREFKRGHIPGAIHISRGILEFKVTEEIPDRNTAVLVYCQTGGRAALAAYTLKQMGYENVTSMAGGWDEWCNAGYFLEKP